MKSRTVADPNQSDATYGETRAILSCHHGCTTLTSPRKAKHMAREVYVQPSQWGLDPVYWAAAPITAFDLHQRLTAGPVPDTFVLGVHPVRTVQLCGLVVAKKWREQKFVEYMGTPMGFRAAPDGAPGWFTLSVSLASRRWHGHCRLL